MGVLSHPPRDPPEMEEGDGPLRGAGKGLRPLLTVKIPFPRARTRDNCTPRKESLYPIPAALYPMMAQVGS